MNESGERTEQATPKKRRDARERGQVFKSNELNTAFCCFVMFGFLLLFWPTFVNHSSEMMRAFLGAAVEQGGARVFNTALAGGLMLQVVLEMAKLILPVLAVAMLAGVLINLLQVGMLFTTKPLAPKLERISPIKGFQRIFSSRTLAELAKSLLKVILLGYVLYKEYIKLLVKFPSLMQTNLYTSFIEIMRMAFQLALRLTFVLAIIAAFDFLYQWWKHEKDLRMTKQEVKDEYKLTEGDPQIKGRIRQKQRQMSAMRMMDQVPSADVVITNPTHYAIALRYAEGESTAPVVVAMGQDYMAQRIRERAREAGVEIVEDKLLARALYQICEVNREIPPEFYQAVADILVYVYRQKNRLPGRRRPPVSTANDLIANDLIANDLIANELI